MSYCLRRLEEAFWALRLLGEGVRRAVQPDRVARSVVAMSGQDPSACLA